MLLFVDTNILLDFYRVRGDNASLALLEKLESNQDRLIRTYQVEMEFKKNRQGTILEAYRQLKAPDWGNLQLPSFLREGQSAKAISKTKDDVKKQVAKASGRILRVLKNPAQHDSVYKSLQRVFKTETELNLGRDDPRRYVIRRLARTRFCLGYPPRKSGDTSYGDAINWEWILHCAKSKKQSVVLVTRDSDFGVFLKNEAVLNDWLRQEFHERVGRRWKIHLVNRLAAGLKKAKVEVTRKEAESEKKVIDQLQRREESSRLVDAVRTYSRIANLAEIHDLGKANRSFQQMVDKLVNDVREDE